MTSSNEHPLPAPGSAADPFANLPPVKPRSRGRVPPVAAANAIDAANDRPSAAPPTASLATISASGPAAGLQHDHPGPKPAPSAPRDYAVGYGKPPLHTRFQKGKSGNPKGRAKGSRNLKTLYREERDAKITVTENGRRKTVTKGAVFVKTLLNNGIKGQAKASDQILKLELLSEDSASSRVAGDNAAGDAAIPVRDADLLEAYFQDRLAALEGETAKPRGVGSHCQ